ncbi:MAG: Ig-like domain-containing protein [Thermoplasmata archaeon]
MNAGNTIEKWYIFRIDISQPEILSINPFDGSTDISVDGGIIIQFSESMNTASVESAISIQPYIEYLYSWNNDNKTLILNSSEPLDYETLYQISISTEAKDLADRGIENRYELEFTTELKPKGGGEGGFPLMYLLLTLILAIIVAVIIVMLIMTKKKKASPEIMLPQIESPQMLQVRCSACNNLLQVNDIGTTMNVTCPFCSTLLTVQSSKASLQMPLPQPQPSTIQISCPKCSYGFTVMKNSGPMQVQCPNCGVKGKLG